MNVIPSTGLTLVLLLCCLCVVVLGGSRLEICIVVVLGFHDERFVLLFLVHCSTLMCYFL